ncbi:MAG: PAS domain S-box protein, partial [Deltaproteobacteria bacterium]|nr:PAS domain S-box protein [Deltaproteobacteria bacterium]
MTRNKNKTDRPPQDRNIDLLVLALGSMHEPAFLVDKDARILFANDEACRLSGYERGGLTGIDLAAVNADFSTDGWPGLKAELREKGHLAFEGRLKTRDGRIVPVEAHANHFEHDGQWYSLTLVHDITSRIRDEKKRLTLLRFFEDTDRIDQVIRVADDLDRMMRDVLDAVLSVLECDRAFLLYPCDPEADSLGCPMERTRPEVPGIAPDGAAIPMDPDVAQTFRTLIASDGPVRFDPGSGRPLAEKLTERSGCRSLMAMALRPKVGKAWQLGVHQCSHPRIWTPEEERLFREIGRRLTDA